MSLCETDWDEDSLEAIALNHSEFYFPTKGAVDQLRLKRKAATAECFHVPIHNPDDLTGMERQFTMQGENEREGKRSSFLPSSAYGGEPELATEGGNSFAKSSSGDRNGFLDARGRESVPAIDVPLNDLAFHDDEMVSWLHYPLEDTFDRNYCTEDIFGELPNPHRIQFSKDSSLENLSSHSQNLGFMADSNNRGPPSSSSSQAIGPLASAECSLVGIHSSGGKAVTADTAMALGAGRAAGLLPQAGAEAFSKVRTSVQPSLSKGSHPVAFISQSPRDISSSGASLQPLKPSDNSNSSPHCLRPSAFNFPHFSRPLAATKSSLQLVGGSSGPTNVDRVRQSSVTPTNEIFVASSQPCAVECSATVVTGVGSSRQPDLNPKGTETRQCTSSSSLREWSLPPPSQQRRQQVEAGMENEELSDRMGTSLSGSAATASERCNGTVDTADFCTTVASRGSGDCTAEYALDVAPSTSKRCTRLLEESENRSEEVEETGANAKKPPSGRTSSSKRARAAEIHNQSERRRRDKINERMKALQELIPNANKTDKASMLDEVIEYLKMLQGQLQLMSMRTGMLVPPVMMPAGIQYLPMQHMPALPHMNLGMGMGMGMGMGLGMGVGMGMGMGMSMMDVGAAGPGAARAVVPLPGLPGQALPGTAYHAAGFQPNSASLVMPEAQGSLQNPQGMNEHYNAYPAQQQPQLLHANMQASMDMYNAFMQQQKQGNSSSKAI